VAFSKKRTGCERYPTGQFNRFVSEKQKLAWLDHTASLTQVWSNVDVVDGLSLQGDRRTPSGLRALYTMLHELTRAA
jgi:hypothetical protein